MDYSVAQAPTITAPRANFNKSHQYRTTIDMDYLYPVFYEEVYPGQTMNIDATVFGRFATLLYPILDNAYIDIHYFWCPMRLVWDNSRKFWGEQDNPGDSIDYTVPIMTATTSTGYAELSLHDYLGLPTKIPDYEHISLYHRAYNLIYNWWYRDQNLIDSVVVDTDDGPDSPTDYTLLKRGKRHDYFTSGIPNLLKDPATAQTLPLGTSAPIYGIGYEQGTNSGTYSGTLIDTANPSGRALTGLMYDDYNNATAGGEAHFSMDTDGSGTPRIYADLTNATAATILQLRQSVQIQALLELDARAGTRYNEIVYATYGVRHNQDSYMPEFLGMGSERINVNQIAQTSNDGTNGNVADLSAFGIVALNNAGFTKSFTEHGVVLGIISARADLTYQQGLDRLMTRSDRYDYLHPLLQGIGDQATLKKEIRCVDPATDTGSTGTPDNERVFNYQERYAELKYKPNKITGLFRSNCTSPLDAWHFSEEFTGAANPVFNQSFIEQNTPADRTIAVTSQPHLILDIDFNYQCAMPMHMYSIPGFGSRL